MSLYKSRLTNLIFLSIILLIPFLEFISFNSGTINERTDLRVNYLTLKRLFFLYIIILLIVNFLYISISSYFKSDLFYLTIFISFIYWLIFQYNSIKKIFKFKVLEEFDAYDGHISFLLIFFFILIFYFFFYRKKILFFNILIFIYLLINFVYLLSDILIFKNKNIFQINSNYINYEIKLNNTKKNNIYLIIIDAMPQIKVADRVLKTRSEEFITKLNSINFKYYEETKSLYGNTFLTIGSLFNLNPLELKDNKLPPSDISNLSNPKLIFPTLLRENNVSNLEYNLEKNGYEIKWIGSHFANCHGYNRKYCIEELESNNIIFNYEILSFLKKTPFQPMFHNFFNIINSNFEEKIIYSSNNSLSKLINFLSTQESIKKPSFIFVHHLVSHWPYLVDSECSYERHIGKTNKLGIKKAFECNKKLILKFAEMINEKDNNSVVIIQSDHNWELSYENSEKYGERNNIINILKLNDFCKDINISKLTNINTVKLALYCATHTDPTKLKFYEN